MFPLELIALFKKSHLLNPSLVSSLDEQFQTPHRSFCLLLKDRDRKVFCWVILIFIFNGKEFRRVFFIILFEHLHYIFCWAFPYVTQGWQVQAVKHNPLHQINYPTPRSSYNYWHRPSYTSESQKIFLTLLLSLFCILTRITWKHFQNCFQNSLHSYCQTALHFPALKKKKVRNSSSCAFKTETAVMTSQTNQCHFQQNYFIFSPYFEKLEQFHNEPWGMSSWKCTEQTAWEKVFGYIFQEAANDPICCSVSSENNYVCICCIP